MAWKGLGLGIKMNVILVDDEELALEVLERMLMKLEGIHICGKYVDARQALVRLADNDIDVVFLDLEMREIHGLQFSEELLSRNLNTEIVFVTAYSQYAIDAFDLNADDYLLKPVSLDRLLKAVNKLKGRMELRRLKGSNVLRHGERILIHTFGTLQIYTKEEEVPIPIKWRTKKVKELFCYLWQNRSHPVNKYVIMEELWPEIELDRGVALLHTTVYQLRKVLKEMGYENGLLFRNEQYQLKVPVKSDLEEMKELLEENEPASMEIKRMLELYEGDYLEQEEYFWSIYQRQTIKNSYLKYLKRYTDKHMDTKNKNSLVESCLQKMIWLDQFNEEYIYLLMTYYAAEGNAKGVTKVYEESYQSMKKELGINSSRKIAEFYREFVKNK